MCLCSKRTFYCSIIDFWQLQKVLQNRSGQSHHCAREGIRGVNKHRRCATSRRPKWTQKKMCNLRKSVPFNPIWQLANEGLASKIYKNTSRRYHGKRNSLNNIALWNEALLHMTWVASIFNSHYFFAQHKTCLQWSRDFHNSFNYIKHSHDCIVALSFASILPACVSVSLVNKTEVLRH